MPASTKAAAATMTDKPQNQLRGLRSVSCPAQHIAARGLLNSAQGSCKFPHTGFAPSTQSNQEWLVAIQGTNANVHLCHQTPRQPADTNRSPSPTRASYHHDRILHHPQGGKSIIIFSIHNILLLCRSSRRCLQRSEAYLHVYMFLDRLTQWPPPH